MPPGHPPRRGFAFHAGDDAVDDGGPFELGEHAEELDEHPTGGGGGVDGFGGGAEGDADCFEFFEEADEDFEGAGEAVDAVDEEDVVAAEAGVAQRVGEGGRSPTLARPRTSPPTAPRDLPRCRRRARRLGHLRPSHGRGTPRRRARPPRSGLYQPMSTDTRVFRGWPAKGPGVLRTS